MAKNDAYIKTLDRAYRILGIRSHSVAELTEKLLKKQDDTEIVEQVIQELRERRYLDDASFASEFIESTLRRRPIGRFLLLQKLKQKGIAEDVLQDALDERYPAEREQELAAELVSKKAGILAARGKNTPEALGRFLDSRGFPTQLIWEIIRDEGMIAGNEYE